MTSPANIVRLGTVLFVTYGGGHIAKVAPVVKELERQGVNCTVLALTVGHAAARRLGLSPVGYRDCLHLVDADKALAWGRKLLDGNTHPDVDAHESCCYLGINYLDWVERFGEAEAEQRYREGGRRSFLPLAFMGRLIDELQPAVVVSTSSPRSEQAAIEAAVQRGIPTLTMMDLFALPYDIYLRQPVHADRITAMSEVVKSNLVAAGFDSGRVRVTGCPAYDALQEPAHAAAGAAFRRERGWEALKIVMWAGYKEEGSHVPESWQGATFGLEVERRLRAWVAARPDVALIVRYHPNQFHYFPSLGEQERVYLARPAEEPVQAQLHASDVVIVQTSTVGLEAALIGRRVLSLQYAPSVIDLGFDFSALGLAEGVPAMDDLVPILDRGADASSGGSILPPAGRAAPRVAAEIRALARGAVASTAQG
ncbi:UDP-glycosyltransferase [Polaromonas sp.]|uniref:UDP-glycosyltransferase n=1 Tax=Polaromonas sp. TaxID=1869339 RepID=UPI003BAC9BF8